MECVDGKRGITNQKEAVVHSKMLEDSEIIQSDVCDKDRVVIMRIFPCDKGNLVEI